jgi:hypothetical protein
MLPPNEASFEFECVGDKTGKKYDGTFTVKCVLANEETIDAALRAERYNGGVATLAAYYKLFNRALAEAEVRVRYDKEKKRQMAPSWWIDSDAGRTLLDQNVVFDVYSKCIEAEKNWNDSVKRMAAEASEKAQAPKPE